MARPGEFDEAICAACDGPLDRDGFCTNEQCGYALFHQDHPGGWRYNQERKPAALRHFEAGCVIANTRSKHYRLPGDRGYARAQRARHAVFYRSEGHARANGYRRLTRD